MEERNTNFFINDGLIMQGEQIDTSVAVKIALDHGWSSIKGEHNFYGKPSLLQSGNSKPEIRQNRTV